MASSGISSVRRSPSRQSKAKCIRVLLLAASPVLRLGLERLLDREPTIEFLGPGAETEPDVVLLCGSPESLKQLSNTLHTTVAPVIFIAERIDPALVEEALALGVRGILPAECSAAELSSAIHAAAEGLAVFSAQVVELFYKSLRRDAQAERDVADEFAEELTSREHEVLEMMMEGLSNKEIAVQLNVSLHTVKFHISSILAKLGAGSRTEATTIGLRRGLITI